MSVGGFGESDRQVVAECWTCGIDEDEGDTSYTMPLNLTARGADNHRKLNHDVRPVADSTNGD